MRALAAVFAFAASLSFGLAATDAIASPSYPDAMKGDLTLSYAPKCALCHAATTPSETDATTPFARSMIARGLKGSDDVASLKAALDAMEKDAVDSDGDGAQDLDELSWGGDPNVADLPEGGRVDQVHYGCSYGHVVKGAALFALAGGAAGIAFAVRRARRKKR